MRLTRNVKAISSLALILALLISAIIGAVLSYMWVVGYYENLKIRVPEKSVVTITNATFSPQDTSFFNVTIFNPSYSPSDAFIKRIIVLTESNISYTVTEVNPPLPVKLPKATKDFSGRQTFECRWDWANHTGETVGIIAFLANGSGPTFEAETPHVDLRITDVSFNPTISATYFNVTVQNFISSTTSNVTVDIAEISITVEDRIRPNITETTPQLPWPLNSGESQDFACTWDWTKHQNKSVTVAVYTSQGYMKHTTETTPPPVTLEITSIFFDVTNTTRFDVTVENNKVSPTYLNVTKISSLVENRTVQEWTGENGTAVNPSIPFTLDKNSTETFACPWNWTEYRDANVTIVVYTLQGFITNHTQVTPPPVILDITNVTFDPIDTSQFNLTVRNSEFSLMNTTITKVLVTIENEIVANLTDYLDLPMSLNRTQSVNFPCPWGWGEHLGKNVTVVVETEQGYSFYSDPITLVALTISDINFNLVNTDHFIVTVQNPTTLNFTLTTMTVTVDGTPLDITDGVAPPFQFSLPMGANYTFVCLWENWTDHKEKEVTITIETLYGYKASHTCKIPSAPS